MKFLRQKTINELKLFGYSGMTLRNYVEAVSSLAKYHGKSPDTLGEEDIKAFLLVFPKTRAGPFVRLPIVLSTSEIERLIEATTDLKHKTILMTFYATGMRLEELRLFRLQNIDSERMTLKFMGKGKRKRYVPLSPVLLTQLRAYWKVYKPKDIFFPSKFQTPYHRRSIRLILEDAKKLAEIKKPGGVHMLRHSFATHLFEAHVPAFTIQKILGHQNIATTQKYVHVAINTITSVKSPLDLLSLNTLKAEE